MTVAVVILSVLLLAACIGFPVWIGVLTVRAGRLERELADTRRSLRLATQTVEREIKRARTDGLSDADLLATAVAPRPDA